MSRKKTTMKDLELKLKLLRREEFKRQFIATSNPSEYNLKELAKIKKLINDIGEEMVALEMEEEYGKQ